MGDKPNFREAMNNSGILAFAHRGAGDHAPENTHAAFRAAVDMGYACLETDIQASRDGTCYAFHDDTLKRLTGENLVISDLTDQDIDRLRIKDKHPIPKLYELFEAFPETLFNLDAKSWGATGPMAELILKMDKVGQVCVGSFSDARIAAVLGQLGPDTCHSVGTLNAARFFVGAQLGLNPRLSANCVQLPMKNYGINLITQKTVDRAHKFGLKVHVWTVNDKATIQNLVGLGVDGIMTDDCGLLKNELDALDAW